MANVEDEFGAFGDDQEIRVSFYAILSVYFIATNFLVRLHRNYLELACFSNLHFNNKYSSESN